jgi:hypothetical protein
MTLPALVQRPIFIFEEHILNKSQAHMTGSRLGAIRYSENIMHSVKKQEAYPACQPEDFSYRNSMQLRPFGIPTIVMVVCQIQVAAITT